MALKSGKLYILSRYFNSDSNHRIFLLMLQCRNHKLCLRNLCVRFRGVLPDDYMSLRGVHLVVPPLKTNQYRYDITYSPDAMRTPHRHNIFKYKRSPMCTGPRRYQPLSEMTVQELESPVQDYPKPDNLNELSGDSVKKDPVLLPRLPLSTHRRMSRDSSTIGYGLDTDHPARDEHGEHTRNLGNDVTICQDDGGRIPLNQIAIPGDDKKEIFVSFVIDDEIKTKPKAYKKQEVEENVYIWTMLFSTLYAVILVLVGIAFPLSEAMQNEWLVSHEVGSFLTYLFAGSSCFLIYLQIEIILESRTGRQKQTKALEEEKDEKLPVHAIQHSGHHMEHGMHHREHETGLDNTHPSSLFTDFGHRSSHGHSSLDMDHAPCLLPRDHDAPGMNLEAARNSHSPVQDVDSLSIYAASVCHESYRRFVLLQHTAIVKHEGASFYLRLGCMLFGVGNFVFVSLEINAYLFNRKECRELVYPYWFQLLFLLIQTFFLFKHTSIHVKRRKGLVRFGLLHCLATNLCIWLRVLTKEVVEAFGRQRSIISDINGTSNVSCESKFLEELSPYLSPFVLEYSLIAVASMAGMYTSLNLRVTTDWITSLKQAVTSAKGSVDHDNSDGHHDDNQPFFSKSHRGLYFGVLLLSGVIVSIILFFLNLTGEGGIDQAIDVYYSSDVILNLTLTVAAGVGIHQMRSLKLTFNKDNTIDDVLILVSLCGHTLLHIFILIASITHLTAHELHLHRNSLSLAIAACFLNITQGLVQTMFVMDGMHRCAGNDTQQREKPCRGVVTFMIISNIAQWIFKTFQVKELQLTNMEAFYGSIAWPLILNVNLPLLLFFRFHSSVCLADIWVSAYRKETGPSYMAL